MNIFLSSKANPRGSVVDSKERAIPSAMRSLVLYDQIATNLYVVDGIGGYDAISGAAGSSVVASIGQPGQAPVWVNSSWALITNGWSGQIAANSAALVALFVGVTGPEPLELELIILVTDTTGKPVSYTNNLVKIYNRYAGAAVSTNPIANSGDGAYTIPNGADTGSVTGLALTLTPRRVMVSVRKPVGGLNLFASVVDGSISTDGFNFTLNGQTDAGTYKLDYVLLY